MRLTSWLPAAFLLLVLTGFALAAQGDLATDLEYGYETLSTAANQQKFLSILFFIIFGGAATYAVLRGTKKIAHVD